MSISFSLRCLCSILKYSYYEEKATLNKTYKASVCLSGKITEMTVVGMQWKNPPVNCQTQKIVVLQQRFQIFDCSVTVPLLKPYLHTLSSCPGLQQCLHTGAALSQDGCLDTHADAHMHTRPLCRHTAPPRSVVLCYAPGRQNWGVTCTDEASIWGWYFVVICFKPAQGTLPEPHALQSFFICCHLHQFLWNRRE